MTRLLACWLLIFIAAPPPQAAIGQAQIERAKEQAMQHYRLGQTAFRTERYDEAEREFKASIALDPTFELSRYSLGQVYMATHRYRDAIDAYTACRAVIHANDVAEMTDQIAHEQRVDDAIKALEDQKRLYQSAGHTNNPAGVRAYLSQIDSQLASLRDQQHRDLGAAAPTPAWLSLALGSAYFRVDDTAHAEQEYRDAIAVNPALGEAHSNLAVVLFTTGRIHEADTEITAAEKTGFKVNPALKEDVRTALSKKLVV